ERWATMVPDLIGRSRSEHVLLPNGADHHARQRNLPAALEALAAAARPHVVIGSSLATFAESLVAAASRSGGIPGIRGELRDSYGYLWTLQGTFSARAPQKRRHAQVERLLLRDCEPWVALAGASKVALLHVAWKSLLLCHPHDTLCGCSTDLVARAMDARLDDAEDQAVGLRDDALLEMIGHDRDRAREEPGSWTPVTLVRNPSARPRSGVAILRLSAFAADVKVGANASPGAVRTARARVPALDGVPPVQVLTKALAHERTEAPRHYPDNDEVLGAEVAAWVGNVPAYGIRGYRHVGRAAKDEIPNPVVVDGLSLSNGFVSVRVTSDGRVTFDDHSTGVGIGDLLSWESREEAGDEYTASPRGPMLEFTYDGARVVHRGPVRGTIALEWRMKRRGFVVTGRTLLTVDAGARFLRIGVDARNAAADHRLRLGIATHLRDARVWADAMFGPVERKPIVATPEDLKLETPPATAPLHRYVSLFTESRGATVYSDGLAEYEADPNGTVFITLLRSVGELSRNDIPERPGHAGWPTPTLGAHCRGPFSARFALMCHGPRNAKTIDRIEHAADDVLLPLMGGTLRSALAVPAPVSGVGLDGLGLACSAITRTDDGEQFVLRCVNLTDETVAGAWTVPAGFSIAALARLDETVIGPLTVADGRIAFVAPPRAVITVLVR
ncbi:MAG: hypothetical protein FJ202_12550, partial [Gemmatimonadetes bacterium]|nr:hypothetical protein [Gemmatimonadota bacterium]